MSDADTLVGKSSLKRGRSSAALGSDRADEEVYDLAGQGPEERGEQGEQLYMCLKCEEEDTMTNLPHLYAGFVFHKHCWSAVRGFHRAMAGNKEAQMRATHNMTHNPAQWRLEVEPYDANGLKSRQAAKLSTQRNLLLENEKTDHVKNDSNLDDLLLLSEKHFVSYVGFWEQMPKAAAKALWEQTHQQQKGSHDRGSEKRIAWRGIEKIRSSDGVEVRSGVESQAEVSESNFEIKRRRLTSKTPTPSLSTAVGSMVAARQVGSGSSLDHTGERVEHAWGCQPSSQKENVA